MFATVHLKHGSRVGWTKTADGCMYKNISYKHDASGPVLFSSTTLHRRSLEILRDGLGCHVIGVEYPGYGLTADGEPNEER